VLTYFIIVVAADEALMKRVSDQLDGPLYYRRAILSDAEFMARAATDPETVRAQGYDENQNVQPVLIRSHIRKDRFNKVVGVERATDRPVGWTQIALAPSTLDTPAWSIGLTLDPESRGHGYGRLVLIAGILAAREQALAHPEPPQVYVGTAVTNSVVQHIMKKIGYEPEPETHPYTAPNGETFDSYWYVCGPTTHAPALPSSD